MFNCRNLSPINNNQSKTTEELKLNDEILVSDSYYHKVLKETILALGKVFHANLIDFGLERYNCSKVLSSGLP